jgi:hypothetical protein
MNRILLRQLQKSRLIDPAAFLINLRNVEPQVARSNLPEDIKHLRNRSLNRYIEARQAAIFCHGMAQRIGQKVYLCDVEESLDYDWVATWTVGTDQHFAPLQLKEVVPSSVNSKCSIESVINSLQKYSGSDDLTVAIHLNRTGRFDLASLHIPPLNIAALWLFCSCSPDQSSWRLWGNYLEVPEVSHFAYPTQLAEPEPPRFIFY